MFQTLVSKVVSGIVSLSMFLLSTYEGNTAIFSELAALIFDKNVIVKTQLQDAFENDFEEIFKSGKSIDIFFDITIKQSGQDNFQETFKHSVIFDPLQQFFLITIEEKDEEVRVDDYHDLIKELSKVEYSYPVERNGSLEITLVSRLPKIELDSTKKKYDLMMLWNFKKPRIQKTFDLRQDES